MGSAVTVPVHSALDIVTARQRGRLAAQEIGMSASEQTIVATAISELARNIVTYAGRGEVTVSVVDEGQRSGVVVVASDEGPGIADVDDAMLDGFSTGGSLGLGLPGVRRLMDEFELESLPGGGTTVTVLKWRR